MNKKVVKLKVIHGKPLVNPSAVRLLESALKDAKKGKLVAAAVVGTWADGGVSHGRSDIDSRYTYATLGGLEDAKHSLLKQMDKW